MRVLFKRIQNSRVKCKVKLLEEKGFSVTKANIHSWRRKSGKPNSRPVPHRILYALFELLFAQKNQNPDFFEYPKEIKSGEQ
ncbi:MULTISPECIES: hypothetical protein [Haemophilus]|jgi:hypothetical protein|uniref:hypothetical protein n=1 Tax=Haemophilus TaxID=724 RepID=UPI0025AF4157|nr:MULTISPECIES: hypothetical protein [Haemophilus]MBS6188904.1 hypothetical protein [Haemophilus parainfluenzae]MDN3211838.1 hypothetical protein [Haemophilus sp. SZY H51]MDU4896014.1 hypothetical protein [Haemophilus parainfluenzae]MDU6707821.1 hypothetical protein [Haemophilus parainfluenzae]